MITDIDTETESDYDDTDHAVSPTSSSSSWRGRNENGTITARAKTSTDKHEGEKESTKSDNETYLLSSWVLENYVKPILLEDSIELINDLLGKFVNWYEEESIYYNELIEECCEREELDKVESLNGQITALNSSFREQLHLIILHCDELLAREERILSEMNERFAEDDNIEHSPNGLTDEQSDEESLETANNAFLPRSNVISHQDEADSYSLNGSTEDDGGVEPPELNDDPFLSRSDIESSDENEDDNMTDMLSSISDSSNDLTESEPEEPPETEDNTSLPRLDVGIHINEETVKSNETDMEISEEEFISKMCERLDEDDVEADSPNSRTEDDDMTYMLSLISDIERRMEELRNSFDNDETDADPQNDLKESEAEDEWFQAVGNSAPMDPESHDIETAGTSYKNGQDSNHLIETTERFSESQNAQSAKIIEIGTDSTESYQDINNLKTVESNETVLDLSGDLSTGIMFGLGHHIEDLATCEPSQQNSPIDSNDETEKEWSVIEDSTSLSDAEPQDEEAVREINGNDQNEKHPMDRSGESPETKPFPQQSNTVSYDGAVIVNAIEVETVDKSVVNKGRSSETILRFKPQEIKRVKPKVKYRNHRQYETDQILTNKSENNAIWMLEVFKRYFRQHLFKSSKPPSIM